MTRLAALVALAIGMILAAASAQAERRVALVIGNGAYKNVPTLANAASDAKAIAAALERVGFEVLPGIDLGTAPLRGALETFASKLGGADVALFFYAGHGLQLSGESYLIPVDAAIQVTADLDTQAISLDAVTRLMSREPRIKIVWLDASRANPFPKPLPGRRTPAAKPGLADAAVMDLLVAYATEPGDVAIDGPGPHSPFTAALLNHIETPDLEIGTMMRRVTREVFTATNERQRPWTNASLVRAFYFKPR